MPLTRYEIRNEYSLANPDLYRAAAKDDPEGLLEGVAMAGLVGIVRQLGDLAEFAAEVFHDLHEEVLATAARGHELLIRVQQLEAELPYVEKLMLAESNYVNFAYNPGLEWHANIHNDQNHFTQGDLPRFIRNAYEDCRGPPRLSLLDKFDVAGAGACLKRYTDPSFFRMEWASSELMKAEKEQQDKKARRIKKKGRRQRNGEIREAFLAAHMQPRMRSAPLEIENKASSSILDHIPKSQHDSEQDGIHSGPQGTERKPQSSRLARPEEGGPNLKVSIDELPQDLELREASMDSLPLSPRQERKLNEASMKPIFAKPESPTKIDFEKEEVPASSDGEVQKRVLPMGMKIQEDVADFASETDNYMDALTTIDSEVETDSEVKTIFQVDGEQTRNHRHEENIQQTKEVVSDYLEESTLTELITGNGIASGHHTPEEAVSSEGIEQAHASSPDTSLAEESDKSMFAGVVYHASHKSNASTPTSGSATSPPPLENATATCEELLESESAEGIPETPETPEANECDRLQLETLTSAFHQLPEPAVPLGNGSQSVFTEHLGSLSSHLRGKPMVLPTRELPTLHAEKDSFGDSESEASEDMKESSPHSSANSSIQPMKWASEFPRHPNITLDSDDELDGMQVSSSSSSSSSSALSSPRPSTLATTVFDNKLQSPLSPIPSSPESRLGISPHSAGSIAPQSPASLMEAGASSSMMSPGHVPLTSHMRSSIQHSGHGFLPEFKDSLHTFPLGDLAAQNEDQSLLAEEPEHFPPPPPLPPLEWRVTKRFGGILSPSTRVSEPSMRAPVPQKPLWRFRDSLPAADLASVPQRIHMQHDEFVHARKRSSTSRGGSQDFSVHFDELEMQTKEAYAPQNDPKTFDESSQAHGLSTELAANPPSSSELVQPTIPFRMATSMLHELPPEASTSEQPRLESFPPLQTYEPSHSFRSSSSESSIGDKEQESAVSSIQENRLAAYSKSQGTRIPASGPHEISADEDCVNSSPKDKAMSIPPRPEQLSRDSRPPLPSSALESDRMSRSSTVPKVERKDSLIAAIAAHDKSTLRKVPEWSQSSRTTGADDREVLLEQIRTGSFSLRRTKVEKQEAPRPVASINVAAILEKANAIRQAFAGSDDEDEDDDWSDG